MNLSIKKTAKLTVRFAKIFRRAFQKTLVRIEGFHQTHSKNKLEELLLSSPKNVYKDINQPIADETTKSIRV